MVSSKDRWCPARGRGCLRWLDHGATVCGEHVGELLGVSETHHRQFAPAREVHDDFGVRTGAAVMRDELRMLDFVTPHSLYARQAAPHETTLENLHLLPPAQHRGNQYQDANAE